MALQFDIDKLAGITPPKDTGYDQPSGGGASKLGSVLKNKFDIPDWKPGDIAGLLGSWGAATGLTGKWAEYGHRWKMKEIQNDLLDDPNMSTDEYLDVRDKYENFISRSKVDDSHKDAGDTKLYRDDSMFEYLLPENITPTFTFTGKTGDHENTDLYFGGKNREHGMHGYSEGNAMITITDGSVPYSLNDDYVDHSVGTGGHTTKTKSVRSQLNLVDVKGQPLTSDSVENFYNSTLYLNMSDDEKTYYGPDGAGANYIAMIFDEDIARGLKVGNNRNAGEDVQTNALYTGLSLVNRQFGQGDNRKNTSESRALEFALTRMWNDPSLKLGDDIKSKEFIKGEWLPFMEYDVSKAPDWSYSGEGDIWDGIVEFINDTGQVIEHAFTKSEWNLFQQQKNNKAFNDQFIEGTSTEGLPGSMGFDKHSIRADEQQVFWGKDGKYEEWSEEEGDYKPSLISLLNKNTSYDDAYTNKQTKNLKKKKAKEDRQLTREYNKLSGNALFQSVNKIERGEYGDINTAQDWINASPEERARIKSEIGWDDKIEDFYKPFKKAFMSIEDKALIEADQGAHLMNMALGINENYDHWSNAAEYTQDGVLSYAQINNPDFNYNESFNMQDWNHLDNLNEAIKAGNIELGDIKNPEILEHLNEIAPIINSPLGEVYNDIDGYNQTKELLVIPSVTGGEDLNLASLPNETQQDLLNIVGLPKNEAFSALSDWITDPKNETFVNQLANELKGIQTLPENERRQALKKLLYSPASGVVKFLLNDMQLKDGEVLKNIASEELIHESLENLINSDEWIDVADDNNLFREELEKYELDKFDERYDESDEGRYDTGFITQKDILDAYNWTNDDGRERYDWWDMSREEMIEEFGEDLANKYINQKIELQNKSNHANLIVSNIHNRMRNEKLGIDVDGTEGISNQLEIMLNEDLSSLSNTWETLWDEKDFTGLERHTQFGLGQSGINPDRKGYNKNAGLLDLAGEHTYHEKAIDKLPPKEELMSDLEVEQSDFSSAIDEGLDFISIVSDNVFNELSNAPESLQSAITGNMEGVDFDPSIEGIQTKEETHEKYGMSYPEYIRKTRKEKRESERRRKKRSKELYKEGKTITRSKGDAYEGEDDRFVIKGDANPNLPGYQRPGGLLDPNRKIFKKWRDGKEYRTDKPVVPAIPYSKKTPEFRAYNEPSIIKNPYSLDTQILEDSYDIQYLNEMHNDLFSGSQINEKLGYGSNLLTNEGPNQSLLNDFINEESPLHHLSQSKQNQYRNYFKYNIPLDLGSQRELDDAINMEKRDNISRDLEELQNTLDTYKSNLEGFEPGSPFGEKIDPLSFDAYLQSLGGAKGLLDLSDDF